MNHTRNFATIGNIEICCESVLGVDFVRVNSNGIGEVTIWLYMKWWSIFIIP
jgi:hypothetical protein